MWIFCSCFASQFGFDCLPAMSCDVTCSPHKANSSYVFSNSLKWTGMRHLHIPYLHIHYYTLHLTRVSSPFCALPPVAAYILEPGHLPSVSLSVEPDLWPLTYLAKVTNKLGHNPHTSLMKVEIVKRQDRGAQLPPISSCMRGSRHALEHYTCTVPCFHEVPTHSILNACH